MYKQIIRWLSTPGAKGAIQGQAPTQLAFPKSSMQEEKEAGILAESKKSESELVHNVTGYVKQVKPHRLDRWLDRIAARLFVHSGRSFGLGFDRHSLRPVC
jgi:hypothetical protein